MASLSKREPELHRRGAEDVHQGAGVQPPPDLVVRHRRERRPDGGAGFQVPRPCEVKSLRVVDASTFPVVLGAFPVPPTMMLSQKASEDIIAASRAAS